MEEVLKLLKENPVGSLATVEDGKPRVRPWSFQFEEEGRLYFCIGTYKDVFKQLQILPYVEFTNNEKDNKWVRVRGEIKFIDDLSIKARIMDNAPILKTIYNSPDNPSFAVFYIEHGHAGIYGYVIEPQLFEF